MGRRQGFEAGSPTYARFLRLEGSLAILFGLIGMIGIAVAPLRGDAADAVRPLDLVGMLPLVVVAGRGWWLLRRRRTDNVSGSDALTPDERRSVRAKMLGLILVLITAALVPDAWISGLILTVFGPLPDQWVAVQGVIGVLANLYGIWVLWRMRRITRAQRAEAIANKS